MSLPARIQADTILLEGAWLERISGPSNPIPLCSAFMSRRVGKKIGEGSFGVVFEGQSFPPRVGAILSVSQGPTSSMDHP